MPKRSPFQNLPTWLPARELARWLKISKTKADLLIAAAPPSQRRRFGLAYSVSKYRFQPDPKLCRELIMWLLRDPNYKHRAALQKEVQLFVKAHGR
jgi:hypothetical protein